MSNRNEYWEPELLTKEQVIDILSIGSIEDLEKALISMVFSEIDIEFKRNIIFKYARDNNDALRGTAILCIGHLARIHGELPKTETIKIILKGIVDSSLYVRNQTESALDDIDIFIPALGKEIRRQI